MQCDKPVLSVILPVFNCERFVGQAIESILNQSFIDFELLIADDGSSDGSRSIIDQYASRDPRIKVSHNLTNLGKVYTANRLFESCRGKFITVHDADDHSQRDRFQEQIDFLNANSHVLMCGTSFVIVTADDEHFRDVHMPVNFEEVCQRIFHASQFHGPTMVIRRAVLDNCLYRPFFNGYNEDCDLAFRLIEKGPCINVDQLLYTYRIIPNSLSKTLTAEKRNYYRMAVEFYQQRMNCGEDDLMQGRSAEVDAMLHSLLEPYRKDPSLIHRENAAFLMYYRLYTNAIRNAWTACRLRPIEFVNWRTLQYCIRKTVLGV